MEPGTRTHESSSLTVSVAAGVPDHMQPHVRELTHFNTPHEDQRKGYASALLREVVLEADAAYITLLLTVRAYLNGMNSEQLAAWYRKFGFEEIQAEPLIMARRPRGIQPREPLVSQAVSRAMH